MANLPPWLDVTPSSFVQAREAGDQMGLQRARLGQEGALESARINQQGALAMAQLHQSAAQAAASLAQKQQELEAGQKQTAVEFQAAQETAKQNFMLRQTQDAVLNAYRQAQIGLGKQRVQQEGQRIQQAVQTATAREASKVDPIAVKQFDTLQSAYLNAVKEYQKAQAAGDGEKAGNLARIANEYKSRADKLAETIRGTGTPAGAFAAATTTGTIPPPGAPLNSPPTPENTGGMPIIQNTPGLWATGREAHFVPPTGQGWEMGPLATASGAAPDTSKGGKVATLDLVQSLKAKGMDKATAAKWLQDNGYTLPESPAPAESEEPAPAPTEQ